MADGRLPSVTARPPQPAVQPQAPRAPQYDEYRAPQQRYDDKHYKKRKRESWLSELFD